MQEITRGKLTKHGRVPLHSERKKLNYEIHSDPSGVTNRRDGRVV